MQTKIEMVTNTINSITVMGSYSDNTQKIYKIELVYLNGGLNGADKVFASQLYSEGTLNANIIGTVEGLSENQSIYLAVNFYTSKDHYIYEFNGFTTSYLGFYNIVYDDSADISVYTYQSYKLELYYGEGDIKNINDLTFYNNFSKNIILNNLKKGTLYTIGVKAVAENGYSFWKLTKIETLRTLIQPTLLARIEGGVTLNWSADLNATMYEVFYQIENDTFWKSIKTPSTSLTIKGLYYGADHMFKVGAYNGDKWLGYSQQARFQVAPQTPTVGFSFNSSANTIYISVKWEGSANVAIVDLYSLDGMIMKQGGAEIKNSGESCSFSNISNPADYIFKVRTAYVFANTYLKSVNYTVYSPSYPINEKFSWTGGDKVKGAPCSILAKDWNMLGIKIDMVRMNKGLPPLSDIGFVQPQYYRLEASSYNRYVSGINDMITTNKIPSVKKGDIVTAASINILSNTLNSIT